MRTARTAAAAGMLLPHCLGAFLHFAYVIIYNTEDHYCGDDFGKDVCIFHSKASLLRLIRK